MQEHGKAIDDFANQALGKKKDHSWDDYRLRPNPKKGKNPILFVIDSTGKATEVGEASDKVMELEKKWQAHVKKKNDDKEPDTKAPAKAKASPKAKKAVEDFLKAQGDKARKKWEKAGEAYAAVRDELKKKYDTKSPNFHVKGQKNPAQNSTAVEPEEYKKLKHAEETYTDALADKVTTTFEGADDIAEEIAAFASDKPKSGVKLTDAQIMQKFLSKAKPETKERMKGMSPAEFMKILGALTEDDEGMGKTASASGLASLLGLLHALVRNHQTAHWQATAEYGDHLLFERLYGGIYGEIDGLAEKMVATFGGGTVDAVPLNDIITGYLRKWSATSGPVTRALVAERDLQALLDSTLASFSSGSLSTGMENFLQGIADAHETNLYLLGQRLAPTAVGRVASKFLRKLLQKQARKITVDTRDLMVEDIEGMSPLGRVGQVAYLNKSKSGNSVVKEVYQIMRSQKDVLERLPTGDRVIGEIERQVWEKLRKSVRWDYIQLPM